MDSFLNQYTLLMSKISHTYIADTIRLDFLLHIIIGELIYLILVKKFKVAPIASLIIVIIVALTKEFFDSFTMTNEFQENITDFLFTVFLPALSVVISKKTKSTKKTLN